MAEDYHIRLGGVSSKLVLQDGKIEWAGDAKHAGSVSLDDVYGVKALGPGSLAVYAMLPHKTALRKQHVYTFDFVDEDAEAAAAAIAKALEGPKRRKLLVLINPFGGTKRGPKVWKGQLKQMFDVAPLDVEVRDTERAGHALQIAREMDLDAYDGVCTVSGDGLPHEVVNGLLTRPDWFKARLMPIGILPAGTGNGVCRGIPEEFVTGTCRALGAADARTAAFNVIKGVVTDYDLLSIKTQDKVVYSHLELLWALVSDMDFESETMRWLGFARNHVAGLKRAVRLRSYRARVQYLPFSSDLNERDYGSNADPSTLDQEESGPQRPYTPGSCPPGHMWKAMEQDFACINAMNVSHAATDAMFAPYAHHNNGAIDFVHIGSKETNSSKITKAMLQFEDGSYVKLPYVHYNRVKAFTIEPVWEHCNAKGGSMDIDGENYGKTSVEVQCHKGLGRFFCASDVLFSPILSPPPKEAESAAQ